MAELLPIQCKCQSSSGVPGGGGPTCGKNAAGQPYKCLFFVTTPKSGAPQGNGEIIRSNYNCGGTLSCSNTKCTQIGCRISMASYCGYYGQGKVCPNLCDFWASNANGDTGYTCTRWGRKMCTNEKCPSARETTPVPPKTVTPPGCTRTCTNGFKLDASSCTCVCNDASHPCTVGYKPKVTGTVEPKKCECVATDGGGGGNGNPPPGNGDGSNAILDFLNKNYLAIGAVTAGLIALTIIGKK